MTPDAPTISLIVSMFRVERYLPDFLASLTRQRAGFPFEVIFVDDGSPDASAEMAQRWLDSTQIQGRLIQQQNAGVSVARNVGLAAARGDWVAFPDPDDVLGDSYLSALGQQIHSDSQMIAARIVMLNERPLAYTDGHPLRSTFSEGSREVDLSDEPGSIKLQAASCLFRRSIIIENDLRFDPQLRPVFEDVSFLVRYLLAAGPRIYFCADAAYFYRRRADSSSLVSSSWTHPGKFTVVPRKGWLSLLRDASTNHLAPAWVQQVVLYDMSWYFRYDEAVHSVTRDLSLDARDEFIRSVRECATYMDAATIQDFDVTYLPLGARAALSELAGHGTVTPTARVTRVDRGADECLVRIAAPPSSDVRVVGASGEELIPSARKIRSIEYFGTTWATEMLLWVPFRDGLRVVFAGEGLPLAYGDERATGATAMSRADARRALRPARNGPPAVVGGPRTTSHRVTDRLLSRARRSVAVRVPQLRRTLSGQALWIRRPIASLVTAGARTRRVHSKFTDAWVFMDRDSQAQDNAEHLYRWVRAHRPEINAWFVLRKTSSDWPRLAREGFRLIAFGSVEHTMLLRNAEHLISSHIDTYVVQPWDNRLYGPPTWRYTFLQHGVTKDDISRWLNTKRIDRLIAAAPREHAAFTDDLTPYDVTTREVALTGFPRHDRLLALRASTDDSQRRLLLIMPTWRDYLMGPVTGKGMHREVVADFESSRYAEGWRDLASDSRFISFAEQNDLEIVFVPHPNLEAHAARLQLPPSVHIRRYAEIDVQDLLARARLLITDYSSLAFDAAVIDVPVIYYQFDRAEFFARHPHRAGYFDYARDGFGPVAETVEALCRDLSNEVNDDPSYAARRVAYFPVRDTESCHRTYNSIAALPPMELVGE